METTKEFAVRAAPDYIKRGKKSHNQSDIVFFRVNVQELFNIDLENYPIAATPYLHELEANPDKYKALMEECFNMIKPEYLNGYLIINGIFGNIAKDLGYKYEFKPGVKSISVP